MSVDFKEFGTAVGDQYAAMCADSDELYVVDVNKDELWAHYLASFPEGSNPIFRERTEHDCSCCRGFIKNLGAVVSLRDGGQTVWDSVSVGDPYDTVARAMKEFVSNAPIKNVFRSSEGKHGAFETVELREGEQETHRWNHFEGTVQQAHRMRGQDIPTFLSKTASRHHVFLRGLNEIRSSAIETVLDLIEQGTLYRAEEFKESILDFQRHQRAVALAGNRADNYAWEHMNSSAARIRNNVIGTLLVDLSEGEELEKAVAKYEAKVAPANYQRPKALVTPRMVEAALSQIEELGLRPSLERRHARFSDVSVRDVLFVDNAVAGRMKDPLREAMMSGAARPAPVKMEDATPISADDFFSDVLPRCTSVKMLMESSHVPRLMSMTAAENEDAPALFNWGNAFGWSYNGDLADSEITRRVKSAGGNVDAALRVSLSWHNTDDLDLHCLHGTTRIYFGNKLGILDVDANASGRHTRTPVENMQFLALPRAGVLKFAVDQYSQRENSDVGFELELAMNGELKTFRYDKPVRGHIAVFEVAVADGTCSLHNVSELLTTGDAVGMDVWGVTTGELVDVSSVVRSPNCWEGRAGNPHVFFIAESIKNPDPVRCLYNEQLAPELKTHRKAFELLGSKTKAPYSEEQFSGLGFSLSRSADLKVQVSGEDFNRAYCVQFNQKEKA